MENTEMIGFEETNSGKLTPQQEAAVRMMLDGKSDGEISQTLKMRRQTINGWRNHNMEFMLELKLKREQAWERQQEKLSQAVEKALDILMEYLEHEDEVVRFKTALFLLQLPATQANLKSKEMIDVKSRYLEVDRNINSAMEQTEMGE